VVPLSSPIVGLDPPNFEEAQGDTIIDGNDIVLDDKRQLQNFDQYAYHRGEDAGSPVSSTGAEHDANSDGGDTGDWHQSQSSPWSDGINNHSAIGSPSASSPTGSPVPALKDVTMEDADAASRVKGHGLGLSL